MEYANSHMALRCRCRANCPQAYPAIHASGYHDRVRFKKLYSSNLTARLRMTLANAQKSAHLVVPYPHFTLLSTRSNQAEMVIELHYCQIALVCTVYAPEALTCLIISLVVNVVSLFISVDNLIHFIFPNEYHVYNVALFSFFLYFIRKILVRNLFFLFCLLV